MTRARAPASSLALPAAVLALTGFVACEKEPEGPQVHWLPTVGWLEPGHLLIRIDERESAILMRHLTGVSATLS